MHSVTLALTQLTLPGRHADHLPSPRGRSGHYAKRRHTERDGALLSSLSGVDNAMPCHRTGYDRYDVNIL